MNAARTEHPIDPPDDSDPPVDYLAAAVEVINAQAGTITGLQRAMDEMQQERARQNWRRLVEAQAAAKAAPPQTWRALKAAAMDVEPPGCSERQRKANYENVRKWCELGVIVAEKRGGHWYVRMDSLQAHIAAKRGK
jgi:hypothetical protein